MQLERLTTPRRTRWEGRCFDKKNFLNDMEKIVFTPNARFRRWKVKRKKIGTLKAMAGMGLSHFESADKYFKREKLRLVPFNVDSIDKLMEGGIDVGSLTEIFGEAGSGKTQLCLQLALSCALPVKQRGLNGQVVYVSTEKGFPVKRIADMASTQSGHKVLDNIFVSVFHTKESLHHFLVERLPNKLKKHPRIKLVVIDSIAGIFRAEANYLERAKNMRWVANELYRLADIHEIAILITNQVTTLPRDSGPSKNIASLGLSWNTQVTTKLEVKNTQSVLYTQESTIYRMRSLEVVYSPRLDCKTANFVIVRAGIEGV